MNQPQLKPPVPAAMADNSMALVLSCLPNTTYDVNGDGLDDLIVGANCADPNGKLDAGKTHAT
jgi:hypothetical protein